MNSDPALKQVFVGSVVALVGAIAGAAATAIINLLLAGKISLNYWWVWGIGAILGALLLYTIYQTNRYPFKKFRVTTNREDGKSLLADSSKGRPVENGAWLFADCTVYGPYLTATLDKGKYRVTYKVKVDNISGENRHIIKLDVLSNSNFRGDKILAARVLTNRDFKRAGEYHYFPLDFHIFEDEREVELRIGSEGNRHNTTLDYIQLSRRPFVS